MRIKKILALILTVGIICTMVVPTFAASSEETYGTGYLLGECNLLLHKDFSIKVPFTLYADEAYTTKATNVTYEVANTDEGSSWEYWANIDANGNLSVAPDALGRELKVTAIGENANSEKIKASQIIKIADKHYFEDFDDETGATVSSDLFKDSKSNVAVVDDGNGGKAAFYKATSKTDTQLEFAFPTDMLADDGSLKLNNYTVNGDYKVVVSTTDNTTYSIDSGIYLLYLLLADTETSKNQMIIRVHEANATQLKLASLYKAPESGDWGDLTNATFNEFVPFNMTYVTDMGATYPRKLVTQFKNNAGSNVASSTRAADFSNISRLSFGGYIDNLEIYSGTINTSASYEEAYSVKGESEIARAYEGTEANISYSVVSNDISTAVPSGIKWSLKEAYTGVSVNENTGVVSIDGAAAGGAFTLQAKKDGSVIAQKTINIRGAVTDYAYIVDTSRIHNDFDTQGDAGSEITTRPTLPDSSDETTLKIFNSAIAPVGKSTVKTRTVNGASNKYASAYGYVFYSSTGHGTNLRFRPSYMDESRNGYSLIDADNVTLSGEFMLESDTIDIAGDRRLSVIAATNDAGTSSDTFLDIRYGKISDGLAGIYSYMKDDGKGLASAGELIAVKPVDEWFDLRAEFDNAEKSFDLYIDDVLVMDNASSNITSYAELGVGCAVDNIILYTGTENKSAESAVDVFVYADGEEKDISSSNLISYSVAKEGTSIGAGIMHSSKYEGATLIVALYDASNKLIGINSGVVEKSDTNINLAYAAVTGDVPAGGYAKVFIWDMEKLTPVN